MLTIKPIKLDTTTLSITSNLDADAFYDKYGNYYPTIAAWAIGTTFTIGQLCHYQTRVYQSVFNGSNVGFNPVTGNTNLSTGLNYWVDLGSLNKFGAFDTTSNTQSIGLVTDTSITFSFTPTSTFTAAAFTNLDADSVDIKVLDPADGNNVIYSKTKETVTRSFTSWYEWVTTPLTSSTNMYFDAIPPYQNKTFVISVNKTSAPKLGGIILGRLLDIGQLELGARVPSQDFSVVNTDEFGNTKLVKRNVFSGIDGSLFCEAIQANTIRELNKSLRGVSTVWIGVTDADNYYFNSLFIMGVATTFEASIDYPTAFRVKLVVKEI